MSKKSKLKYLKEWKKNNPEKVRAHARKSRNKNKKSVREYQRAWVDENRDHVKQKQHDWYEKSKRRLKSKYLQREFGITIEQYEEMEKSQNGKCSICGNGPDTKSKSLAVDHDHKTGKVRSLLCRGCNVGIGNLQDDPNLLDKAASYVRKYRNE